MAKGNFRKRRRDIDRTKFELLPSDAFPSDVILTEFQGRRVSNLLLDFAAPLLSKIAEDNFFQFKTMLYFSAVAWNFSYFKQGEERHTALDRFLLNSEFFQESSREKMYNIVDSLSIRKTQSFWQYDVMFLNFEVMKGENGNTVTANAIPAGLMNIPVQ